MKNNKGTEKSNQEKKDILACGATPANYWKSVFYLFRET